MTRPASTSTEPSTAAEERRIVMSTALTSSHATPPTPTTAATAIRPQRLSTVFLVELRKLTDTRSGKAIVGIGVAIPLIALTWLLIKGTGSDQSWRAYSPFMPVLSLTIPLIGLFAMTAEWTQRTALTTFTLSPRRGRVLAMKFLASFAMSMVVTAVVVGLTIGATALGGLINGETPSFEYLGSDVRGLIIMLALQVTMAAGFGALAAQTAVAVGAFLVAPMVWTAVGPLLFGENAQWLDVFSAYARLSSDTPLTDLPQTLVAITLWVILPTTIGVVRSLRREVK
jgi:ABC-type transport system involved in multi-copper enzyme maturation permease subunit